MRLNYKYNSATKFKEWIWGKEYSLKKVEKILRQDIFERIMYRYNKIIIYSDKYISEDCWVENDWCEVITYADVMYIQATEKGHFWLNMTSTEKIKGIISNIKFDDIYSAQIVICDNSHEMDKPYPRYQVIAFSRKPFSEDEYYCDKTY